MSLDVTHELSQNFIEYAVAVNTDRSIPDAKCGLKPVARRIIYDAYYNGHTSNKAYVKNANIVGEVMAKFHPHGDSSIYGALVRLSQPWVMRYPLIDFHGNRGNIAGDPPASYRYTEGRLDKLTEDGLLAGIKKDNIPFMPNFDETIQEPVTLPAVFPNLLCNPNTGIGVAMACNWAPHNLGEVAQAIYDYIDGKEPMLPGPDFPTGGIIINKNDIPNIMRSGKGSVKLRARYEIKNHDIIVTEIPYNVTIEGLLEEISKAADAGEISGISEIQDQSSKGKIKIVIICDKTVDPNLIINQLFAKTNLQTSFSYNQVALIDKTPVEMNLRKCCEVYVNHNIDCLVKEISQDIETAQTRVHIIDGLLIALEDIDNVITLIKKSEDSSHARDALMQKYHIDESQAKAILAMRLSSLAKLEKVELQGEQTGLLENIKDWNAIINSHDLQIQTVKNRLDTIVKKYGDARRTELAQIALPSKEEKEIINVEPEKCVVILTENNTLKRIPTDSFKPQKRAGKGVKTQEDITSMVLRTNTVDSLMVFTNQATMYRLLVNNIPEGTNTSKGTQVSDLIDMRLGERAEVIYSIYRDTDAKYVLFTTKNGIVKKSALSEYISTKKKGGVVAIKLKDDDTLANVSLIKEEPIAIVTKNGQVIKFDSKSITPTSRVTAGIKAITLAPGDEVLTTLVIRNDTDALTLITESGLGKKTALKEYPVTARGGKGIIGIGISDNSRIAAAALVSDEDSLLIVGERTSVCLKATEIPFHGRSAHGNVLMKGRVKAVSKL